MKELNMEMDHCVVRMSVWGHPSVLSPGENLNIIWVQTAQLLTLKVMLYMSIDPIMNLSTRLVKWNKYAWLVPEWSSALLHMGLTLFCPVSFSHTTKKFWSSLKVRGVKKVVLGCIYSGKVPGKSECKACIMASPVVLKTTPGEPSSDMLKIKSLPFCGWVEKGITDYLALGSWICSCTRTCVFALIFHLSLETILKGLKQNLQYMLVNYGIWI